MRKKKNFPMPTPEQMKYIAGEWQKLSPVDARALDKQIFEFSTTWDGVCPLCGAEQNNREVE